MLAAGASTRLGQAKALVDVDGKPLIQRLVKRLESADLKVIIVTRRELAVDIMLALPGRPIVVNPNPEHGRTGSLQVGLRAVIEQLGAKKRYNILLAPVDRPGFSSETLEALVLAKGCSKPVQNGRGGHPILLTENEVGAILAAAPDAPLNSLMQPARIEVNDAGIHFNLDTPEDLAELPKWLQ